MWGGRIADTARWKPLLVLEADSAGWLPENQPDGCLRLRGLFWQRYEAVLIKLIYSVRYLQLRLHLNINGFDCFHVTASLTTTLAKIIADC